MTSTTTTTGPDGTGDGAARRGLWYRLYHGETTFDFNGRRWVGFAISGTVLLISVLSLFTRGLNLGIDFEGGVVWEVPAENGLTVDDVRDVVTPFGLEDARIQTLSGGEGERVRVQAGPQGEQEDAITSALAEAAEVDSEDIGFTSVGPSWGEEITDKAVRALVFFFIAIALYISFRFEWRMAVGAIAAVVHDILISVGIYSLAGFEVTPATVIAFLTILGFSLYDTIVVFDKVKENTRRVSSRFTYGDVVNLSMNQTLMRSLNTSVAAILPVLALLLIGAGLLGAVTLQEFAIALLVGLFVGAYSSIAIATPVLAVLKEREPRYRDLKRRAAAQRSAGAGARVAAAREDVGGADEDGGGGRRPRAARVPVTPAGEELTVTAPAGSGATSATSARTGTPARPAQGAAKKAAAARRPGTAPPPRPRKKRRR
ncbi:MAG TPA: protein translocase subunit SecF [Acidimicrobiales bacterium]|jgi:preprotein translocase subunit SecF